MNIENNSIRRTDPAYPGLTTESQEKFEARTKLLTATHNLRHAQGNAVAFALKAELAKTDDERRDCIGCVAYWDRISEQHTGRIRELSDIINRHW